MGKAKVTSKRRVSAATPAGDGAVDANVTPPPSYDAAVAVAAPPATPQVVDAAQTAPDKSGGAVEGKEMEVDANVSTNDEAAMLESPVKSTPVKSAPQVEIVNTPVSSQSTFNLSQGSSLDQNTTANTTTGSANKSTTGDEDDSLESIPGMFASVSMIADTVKTDYPVTARPPSAVTMGVVSFL